MMGRLTIRLPENPAYIPDEDTVYLSDEFGAKCWQGEAIDRLADYEDTGLPPDEVARLTAEIEQYRKAEADGMLVRLPEGIRKCDVCKQSKDGWCNNVANDGYCIMQPTPEKQEVRYEG